VRVGGGGFGGVRGQRARCIRCSRYAASTKIPESRNKSQGSVFGCCGPTISRVFGRVGPLLASGSQERRPAGPRNGDRSPDTASGCVAWPFIIAWSCARGGGDAQKC